MTKEKIFKIILFIIIGLFISSLIALKSGYYDNKISKNKVLTEEEILKFEEDIRNGKEIDVTSYNDDNYVAYNNNISDGAYDISLKLERLIDITIKQLFKNAANLVSN